MILLNSVLVATDFGETSVSALAYGRNMARSFGGTLHVLHVAEPVTATAAAEFYLHDRAELQQAAEDAAALRLKALMAANDMTGVTVHPVVRVSSETARAIVEYDRCAPLEPIR